MKKPLHSGGDLAFRLWVLGNDLRLQILAQLQRQPMAVKDLTKELRTPQPTISRHLKYLSEAGFVVRTRSRGFRVSTSPLEQIEYVLHQMIHKK